VTHPDFEMLIACRDGELSRKQQSRVHDHLRGCGSCRAEFARFRTAVSGIRPRAATTPIPCPDVGQLTGLRTAIRKWKAARVQPERSGDRLKNRVAKEIGPFLGSDGTRKLLTSVSDSGNNLLGTVEQVLVNFLGKRAASELVNRVVDRAILQDNL